MRHFFAFLIFTLLSACVYTPPQSTWILVDNFEQSKLIGWHKADVQNNTKPYVETPQVTQLFSEDKNRYLLKKPAIDGLVGNRKALSFKALPESVTVGEGYTFYTRISVERFPNNHAFGLSNLPPAEIKKLGYNAFEPTLRVTD